MNFSDDLYFWVGLGLLAVSTVGVMWILRALKKKNDPEPEASPLANFSDFFTPPMPPAPTPAQAPVSPVQAAPPPRPAPASAAVFQAPPTPSLSEMYASAKPEAADMETLSRQLERIDQSLRDISEKLDGLRGPAAGPSDAISQENGGSAKISDLSVKIEKIYQVLASLSGSAPR